ncbi:MAG: DUF1905 domain-containing protein [Bacteroidota bacterium]
MQFSFTQAIRQLEARKGGYYYFKLDAEIINQFEKKRATRLICEVEGQVSYSCGLNHYGDGNYFIILATKYLKKMGKELGDEVNFKIYEDPNPLGVAIPEVLAVFLEQDKAAKSIFNRITDGKKRSLIYQIKPIKDVDKQVHKIQTFLTLEAEKLQRKGKK